MSNVCEVKASPSKGTGVFATKAIKPGTVIMRDTPCMKLKRPTLDITEEQVSKAFAALTPEAQEDFMQLHENDLPYKSQTMRIYKSNAFGDESESWLFLNIARFNHSCDPNAEITEIDNDTDVKVVALKPIAKGEEVLICYIGPLEEGSKSRRAQMLKETYGFACDCSACHLPPDLACISDARRDLINVLSHKQQGLEPESLQLMDNINGTSTGDGHTKALGRSKRPLKIPPTQAQKVANNFLLAKLLEAEGQVNYRLAQAYVMAALCLLRQVHELETVVVLRSAGFVADWMKMAVEVMNKVRERDSRDMQELQEAWRLVQKSPHMSLAASVVSQPKGSRGSDRPVSEWFAVRFEQPEKVLSQEECKRLLKTQHAA